jgi:ketosteroid isomerase-like protein/quercetin dioxygenase-like cupin family protein
MRRLAYVLLLAVVAGCAKVNVEEEQKALLAADREWSQTTKDLDKFMTYVAADANGYPQGSPVLAGADAFRKFISQMMAAPGFALSWTATKAVVAASGDIGYTTGTYDLAMAGTMEKGKYVTAWKKVNGAWKVADDIFNADAAPAAPAGSHVMLAPGELKWGDAPPSLPPGAKMTVLQGDPTQAQLFVVRAQVPAGYKVPPHWHPGVENLTILSGTVALGMGETFDESKMTPVPVGGYASLPAEMRHYFMAKTASTFQVHGMGPFVVNYVNPADDPSKQASK